MVDWLLSNGADRTIPEENGYTPMHAAAFSGHAAIVKMLLLAGLDPSERIKDGWVGAVGWACHRMWVVGAEPEGLEEPRAPLPALGSFPGCANIL